MSSLDVSIEQAKRSTQDKSDFAALVDLACEQALLFGRASGEAARLAQIGDLARRLWSTMFLPVQLHGNRFTVLEDFYCTVL